MIYIILPLQSVSLKYPVSGRLYANASYLAKFTTFHVITHRRNKKHPRIEKLENYIFIQFRSSSYSPINVLIVIQLPEHYVNTNESSNMVDTAKPYLRR